MNKFRFFDWKVYKEAKQLFSLIFDIVCELPKEYRFELGSQLVRSALSVVLNIAEGSARGSDRELNRFLDIALGSVAEVLAALDVAHENKLVSQEKFQEVFQKAESINDQLGGFKKQLKRYK